MTISEDGFLPTTTGRDTAPDATNATVLIVDDDHDALDLLTMVMERAHFKVLRARDGKSALALAKEHYPVIDAVLLDIMMPGELDGYDVCERLKADSTTSKLPVIVLSAKSTAKDMARSYAVGAVQHINKPYDIHHLLEAVKSMIRLRLLERNATLGKEKYRAIIDNSPLRMVLLAPDFTLLETNRAFRDEYPEVQIGDNHITAVYDELPEEMANYPAVLAFSNGEVSSGTLKGLRHGKSVTRKVFAAPIKDKQGKVIAVVEMAEDITRQKETEEHLQQQVQRHSRALRQQELLAEHLMKTQRELRQKNTELEETRKKLEALTVTDTLTELNNRRYFDQAYQNEWQRAARYRHSLSVVMMDLDYFKNLNDTYGHQAGDAVLKAVAESIREQLRETDIKARYGGEEFVAILPETSAEIAEKICERLRVAVSEINISHGDCNLKVTISIGLASSLGDTVAAEILLKRADNALYAAKAAGRNCVIIDDHPVE